jgi:hypothetical protein
VQRRPDREHHVVRHVDDVRDRAHPGPEQPRLQPQRRRADDRVPEQPPDVTRAPGEILDANVDGFVRCALRVQTRRRRKLGARQRSDLARDAVDRRQIGPVESRLDLEHVVDEWKHVRERRAGLGDVVEDDDPGVVGAELELALGQDHPARHLAAELRLAQWLVGAREHRPGERDGDRRAGAEVPRAADDLARLSFADVDAAELEAVGVRVLARFDDLADEEAVEVAVDVGHAAPHDAVDLAAREHELRREALDRPVERDVLAQPGDWDPQHQNCERKRMSFSQ